MLNEPMNVKIDGILFNIKVVNDSYGPLRIVFSVGVNRKVESSDSEGSSDDMLESKTISRIDSSTMSRFDWLLLFESLITCWKIGAQEVFFSFVKSVWDFSVVAGKRSFGLKEKVKHLKNHLKLWNMSNFCSLDMQAKEDVKKINNLDELATTSEREVCKQLMEV
ncbi:hypothetical protein KIW84_076482 [Lathyrus oleraceus]|uniref:Uncharacterized protein n=1 Tax=Pisum sativum TaxID=3888 RepID=A0A9D4VY67_PEA|nr:hypothetical protein KIW84_076482 [Pisum sativum]